ncbi:hypothetical protein NMG60_11024863 [Bertholletia excelsa]
MDLSIADDLDKTERLSPNLVRYESRVRRRNRGEMDISEDENQINNEFWPIEHPIEPPDEDQPVKCPMPVSSAINEQFSDSPRKRTEVSAAATKTMKKQGILEMVVEDHPGRPVRKRHHTSTLEGEQHTSSRMPPHPHHNITIFQMLQQFNNFQS